MAIQEDAQGPLFVFTLTVHRRDRFRAVVRCDRRQPDLLQEAGDGLRLLGQGSLG